MIEDIGVCKVCDKDSNDNKKPAKGEKEHKDRSTQGG